MGSFRIAIVILIAVMLAMGSCEVAPAGQVWIKCHITCRCLQDNTVGNFAFNIALDRSPDTGFDADLACNSYAHRTCLDGCNGTKFSYTYQVTSP